MGDRVLLSTRNSKFKKPNTKKLIPRFVGPFTITEKIGNVSYKLSLPDTMRMHPILHVELLPEFKGEAFTPPPEITCEDGTILYKVDRVLDARCSGSTRQYLVRWKEYGLEYDTWEPRRVPMLDCQNVVDGYEQWLQTHNLEKPKTRRRTH